MEIARQIAAFREAFAQKGLPFGQVIGFVAQPGVEFGDDFVNAYAPRRAAGLMAQMRGYPDLVLEGHSTDYQTRESLSSLVRDGVAILKVGPALTFALREALMLAQQAAGRMGVNVDFTGALENAMLADDRYWKSYYSGTEREVAYKRLFSFSDRCRYYLPDPGVEQAVQTLLTQCGDLPPALLSLYFPGSIPNTGTDSWAAISAPSSLTVSAMCWTTMPPPVFRRYMNSYLSALLS